MPNVGGQDSNNYGLLVTFIFIFNLIVGTGSLTMPKAFENTGYLLSTFLLIFLTLISFITATFMFESMSITNAIKKYQKIEDEENKKKTSYVNQSMENEQQQGTNPNFDYSNDLQTTPTQSQSINNNNNISHSDEITINEDRPLMNENSSTRRYSQIPNSDEDEDNDFNQSNQAESASFDMKNVSRRKIDKLFLIRQKYEMSEMAGLFFSKLGQFFFYLAMILYLYGDLAIYDAAVPKSFRDTTCTYASANENDTLTDSDPCWTNVKSISRFNAYRIYVVVFNSTIGVLVFYNIQKTKLLQLLTTLMRWVAFITMISLAVKKIHDNHTSVPEIKPEINVFNIKGVPNFFGICIYAFMCHHSLPSIITPMKQKEKYKIIFTSVYLCIMVFYLLLSFTGVFAFGKDLDDFYTLNFLPKSSKNDGLFLTIIDYYLSLFPVFTISASFPIIGITLRNNLKSLYYFVLYRNSSSPIDETQSNYFVSIGLPLITLIPPMLIALITHDLQLLVGITGSYAGVAIQYIIPSCLVYFGRREAIRVFRENFQHSYISPFKHKYWVFFVLIWANVSIIFVTVNHILN